MRILLTGAAGFIGFFTAQRLMADGHQVVGIDNLNDYYPSQLKRDRLAELEKCRGDFDFIKLDLADRDGIADLFSQQDFEQVIHLGAQAGVRYSLENPHAYADSNITGTLNILEGCRHSQIKHLVYASSSSVYGMNSKMPFATSDNVDHPVSLYAATKKSNELMAHAYSHLYQIPTSGLRFFTVYGPWGRPDMAYWLFAESILKGEPIRVFNQGKLKRDFTYIDDIVEGVVRCLNHIPQPDPSNDMQDPSRSRAPYRVYNIGNNQPVQLETFISTLEDTLGKKAIKEYLPMQPGDVEATWADIDDLSATVGYRPDTPLAEGLKQFADWFVEYRND